MRRPPAQPMALRVAGRRRSPRTPRGWIVIAATLVGAASAREARADCNSRDAISTCFDADNLWLQPGAGPFLSVGSGTTVPVDRFSFGLGLSYLSRPVAFAVGGASPDGAHLFPVDNALNASFLFAFGVTDRFELNAVAPITLYQDGAGAFTSLGSTDALPRSAIRDMRFGATFALLRAPRVGPRDGLGIVTRVAFGLPAGEDAAFAGARTMTLVPSIAAELRLGRVTIGADVGARVRGGTEVAGAVVGSQISTSLGVAVDVLPPYLTAGAEAFALVGLDAQRDATDAEVGALVPAEWMATVSSAPFFGGDVSAVLGAGGPIPLAGDLAFTSPRLRASLALRYAPTGRDADADGVLDRDDLCPNEKEDRDGFEDADGCRDDDNDRDNIPDETDRCRDAAETVDGFEDLDGCPDPDDDGDKIPDEEDQCRNQAEDRDGFEDEDGCPEADNDRDGLLDDVDLCKNAAEDFDGFRDRDGCPEPDNDLDNLADDVDLCPDAAEDRDGFNDTDGCPDPDNDEDGILDTADQCKNAAETIDGKADEDGCPEPGAKSLVRWNGSRAILDPGADFSRGSAKPSAAFEAKLRMLAQLVAGAMPEGIVVEGYPDRPNDTSAAGTTLAESRAFAVRDAFVAAGLKADRITAVVGDVTTKRPAGSPAFDVTVRRPRPAKKAATKAP